VGLNRDRKPFTSFTLFTSFTSCTSCTSFVTTLRPPVHPSYAHVIRPQHNQPTPSSQLRPFCMQVVLRGIACTLFIQFAFFSLLLFATFFMCFASSQKIISRVIPSILLLLPLRLQHTMNPSNNLPIHAVAPSPQATVHYEPKQQSAYSCCCPVTTTTTTPPHTHNHTHTITLCLSLPPTVIQILTHVCLRL